MCYYHIKIPRFFKMINTNKNFKEDTKALFTRLSKHKKKIFFLTTTIIAYNNQNLIKKNLKNFQNYLISSTDSILKENNTVDRKFKTFLKQSLGGTFKDEQIKREGVLYLEKVLKDKTLITQIIQILLKSIKEEKFIQEAKVLGKNIVVSAAKDKRVEKGLIDMFIRIVKNPEIKFEASELVKFVVNEPDSKEELVNLLIEVFKEEKVILAFKNLLAGALFDVLSEKETARRLQIFFFNFVKSQEGHDKNSILDLVMDKVMKKDVKKKEDKDLDEFFKDLQNKKDIYIEKNLDKIWKEKNKKYSE